MAGSSGSAPWRVLITGATGFIGGRLCEVLALNGIERPRAFIHSTAGAGRIARLPLEFALGDLCDRASVIKAVQECDAVVHLARGEPRVMRQGLDNVLRAAVNVKVKRFVHVSSVAVCGSHPPSESSSESVPARSPDTEYGREKLQQEHRVLAYARRYGLPAVILRPPTVYGPFSPFTLGLLERIRSGTIAVVNDGANPCNLVYVDNLVEAVLLALFKPEAVGQTFFVTDPEGVTWGRCLTDHARWAGAELPQLPEGELVRPSRQHPFLDSLRLLPRVLMSAQFRSVVGQVPIARAAEARLYGIFQSLPSEMQQGIRLYVSGPRHPAPGAPAAPRFSTHDPFIAAQLRAVRYSTQKARRILGYAPPVSYHEGMQLTETWLRCAHVI